MRAGGCWCLGRFAQGRRVRPHAGHPGSVGIAVKLEFCCVWHSGGVEVRGIAACARVALGSLQLSPVSLMQFMQVFHARRLARAHVSRGVRSLPQRGGNSRCDSAFVRVCVHHLFGAQLSNAGACPTVFLICGRKLIGWFALSVFFFFFFFLLGSRRFRRMAYSWLLAYVAVLFLGDDDDDDDDDN
jgi:hypothetical protein